MRLAVLSFCNRHPIVALYLLMALTYPVAYAWDRWVWGIIW